LIRLQVQGQLDTLEWKLSYQDIRFYRSIARSQHRKDVKASQVESPKPKASQNQGWLGWIWGGTNSGGTDIANLDEDLTDEQRRELYDAVDYDEKTALAESFEASKETQKVHASIQLKQASFRLLAGPHSASGLTEIVSIVADGFDAELLQRPDNYVLGFSLGNFSVFDRSTFGVGRRQVVQVKRGNGLVDDVDSRVSFFRFGFEHNPLDGRANTCLTLEMESMEIVYYRSYIEAIYRFFKPPESQLESVEALLVR
jgi:vacuolar protein sorting-associated protein 13A/C